MRCSIDSFRIAVRRAVAAAGCSAFVIVGIATSAEPVAVQGDDRPANDAITNLVAFLEHSEAVPGAPHQAPQPDPGFHAGPPGLGGPHAPGQGGAIVLPPKVAVFSFGIEVGADGKVKQGPGEPEFTLDSIEGLEGIIARHVMQGPSQPQPQPPQGPHHPGQPHHPQPNHPQPNQYGQPQFQAPLPPHVPTPFPAPAMAPVPFDAHAHVTQQLDQILGKLDRLEARLGGSGPQGQPPMGPLPHGGPRPSGPFRGGRAPQFQGRVVAPGREAPPHGSMSQDELNHRFEEHARDLHRHVEEMARGLGEKLKSHGGMAEEFQKHHEKIVRAHEQIQERFQDIRRRFADQQERIERLEQEVRRLHEAHGRAEGHGEARREWRDQPKREEKGSKRRDEEKQGNASPGSATPQVSYDEEGSESL